MIVVELQGGMGNQMFQYAVARHLSIIHQSQLMLDVHYLNDHRQRKDFTKRHFDLDVFNITPLIAPLAIAKKYGQRKGFIQKIIKRLVKQVPLQLITEKKFGFDAAVLSLPDNIYLNGYWQSEKYFIAIKDIILKDFTFKSAPAIQIQQLQAEIKKSNAVCVHVRRGDFVKVTLHGTLGMEYYGKAAALLNQKINNPVYYIFSDDISWCRQNIIFPGNTVFYVGDEFAGEKSTGHFSSMIACSYFIIPNSSFAWWAAWLNTNPEKIVIAPKVWFHNSSLDTKDLLPSNWITL
jgi:hypothetical protein